MGSHDRPQLPRHKFALTIAMQLAAGGLTAGRGQQRFKNTLSQAIDVDHAVDHFAAIDVDIVHLALIQRAVG